MAIPLKGCGGTTVVGFDFERLKIKSLEEYKEQQSVLKQEKIMSDLK